MIDLKRKPMACEAVKVTDDYCSNALNLELMYLLSFDVNKWLYGFRETAGLEVKGESRYGGWENTLIGGHAFGHYLTACARAYVNPDVSDNDKKTIYSIITKIIDGLLVCQKHSRGKKGFIFAATLVDSDNVEAQFDNVEAGHADIFSEAWVPWYTMHKILAGVTDVYRFMGYEPALTVAKALGDWVYERAMGWNEATRRQVLAIEYGGMNDCLYDLCEITGDMRYAEAAHAFDEDELFERVLSGGEDVLNRQHANTTIPKFIGAMKRYVTLGESEAKYFEYAKAFWDMVVDKHTYVTGGNSEWEHFGNDSVLDAKRTNANNETCNVYNMLKLSRLLFMATGDKKYADYYENAFINAILSSQNPVTGMSMYFQPMATGYFKCYGTRYTKFWCCTGSGMENFTKLSDGFYFADEDSIYVNLYMGSVLELKEKGVTITAEDYLAEREYCIYTVHSEKSAALKFRFRMPDWLADNPWILLNGVAYPVSSENGYMTVKGNFSDGDTITVHLPMKIVCYGLADNDRAVAFKYGPYVLSAGLGHEDMRENVTGIDVTIPEFPIVDSEYIVLDSAASMEDFRNNPDRYFERKGEELVFELRSRGLVFKPHYLRHNERYGIYWYMAVAGEDLGGHGLDYEVIDTIEPGYGQYENDELHRMVNNNSMSVTNDGVYRYAMPGGYFEYRMAVKPGVVNKLVFEVRSADAGKTIKVAVGGETIMDRRIEANSDKDLYQLEIDIPKAVVAGAVDVECNEHSYKVITVRFSGNDTEESAAVCEFIYVRGYNNDVVDVDN